jgi:predicted GIY-YIG superfamily endonuclease
MKGKQGETAPYRLFGSDGRLLYIGVSCDLHSRFAQHSSSQSWWPQVARWKVEWLASRKEALAAERAAIMREHPRFNKKDTFASRHDPALERVLKGKVAHKAAEIRRAVEQGLLGAGRSRHEARAEGRKWERTYKQASGLDFLDLGTDDRREAADPELLEKILGMRGARDLLEEIAEHLRDSADTE